MKVNANYMYFLKKLNVVGIRILKMTGIIHWPSKVKDINLTESIQKRLTTMLQQHLSLDLLELLRL